MQSETFGGKEKYLETFGKANIRSPSTISTLGVSSLFDASSSCHRDTFGSSWEKEARARKRRNFWDVSCDPQEMCEIRHRNCDSFVSAASIAFLQNMVGSFSESGGDLVVGD